MWVEENSSQMQQNTGEGSSLGLPSGSEGTKEDILHCIVIVPTEL